MKIITIAFLAIATSGCLAMKTGVSDKDKDKTVYCEAISSDDNFCFKGSELFDCRAGFSGTFCNFKDRHGYTRTLNFSVAENYKCKEVLSCEEVFAQ